MSHLRPDCDDDTPTWWVYLLACENGRTYAGVALNVEERFKTHVEGKGAKFTRANRPISILGKRAFPTQSEALRAEYALKQLERDEKLQWAQSNPPSLQAR
jgi:putative endonuclease